MSATLPPVVSTSANRRRFSDRVLDFWQRISEGRQVDELWSQFVADTRASYGFYMKESEAEGLAAQRGVRRWFGIAKTLFWSLLMKMTPARRVLLLVALLLLVVSGMKFQFRDFSLDPNFEIFAVLVLLLLLSLELADKVTMKRDLEIAREIQTWLVPAEPPQVPNADIAFATRPQNSVAGDYYDAFYPLKDAAADGKLLLVIADVAGKSVPAALLMATLQASLRTIAESGVPLRELVHRLNHYACAHSLDGRRFTTAVIAEYEPAVRRLTYVNAGHNAPALRRANGELERLDTGGLPLGIVPEANYETAVLAISPGDALIFYTDGVVEAFDEKGQEFGEVRWINVVRSLPAVSAQNSLQFLMRHVDDFVGATRQSDDITCLVFRVN